MVKNQNPYTPGLNHGNALDTVIAWGNAGQSRTSTTQSSNIHHWAEKKIAYLQILRSFRKPWWKMFFGFVVVWFWFFYADSAEKVCLGKAREKALTIESDFFYS